MDQFSFIVNNHESVAIQLKVPNSLTPKLINLGDVYFITMKPFSSQADHHYHIHIVFSDKEKNIIQETTDGRFVQFIELYVMLNKVDVENISNSIGVAHPSIVCIQDGKNIQILNLDKVDGFDIHQSSTANVAIDSDSSFFDVQFHPNKDAKTDSIISHKSEDVLVKVSIVFHFLYQYAIETNIPLLIKAINQLNKDLIISSRLSGVQKFLKEHKLDGGFITINSH